MAWHASIWAAIPGMMLAGGYPARGSSLHGGCEVPLFRWRQPVCGRPVPPAGAVTVNNVAEWSGGNWYALHDNGWGITGTNGFVYTIGINQANSYIYIGGTFATPAVKFPGGAARTGPAWVMVRRSMEP